MFPAPALLGTAGLGALYFISAPAREFLARKFRKLPDISRHKIFRPCWQQGGLLGLGLISPVTIGPKGAALLGLAAGEKPLPLLAYIVAGALPWALGLAWASNCGLKFLG
ncbi:MAG: hypothetical protein JHD33_07455 [Chthoniobacterales bacterium]|jgi:hypothetical protein|nr:hypothetical protein [Chthoniobacterales bacterium]